MDQLSQRSSSERTQFMSREDLDQEGSLDLDHDHYHYQDHYTDQELEQYEGHDQKGDHFSTPTRTLELKVHDDVDDDDNDNDDDDCSSCRLGVVAVVTNDSPLFQRVFLTTVTTIKSFKLLLE